MCPLIQYPLRAAVRGSNELNMQLLKHDNTWLKDGRSRWH